ncbi:unnamed protein product [Blepharisma stoltei]|uniref:Uncharacterized protein n=1 Tax=Blepharisma stoltei TaxID=1481888 RepID=A0AAU9IZQ9_9CILI|nr:unnamed protein product [Blepharisma stoltei]
MEIVKRAHKFLNQDAVYCTGRRMTYNHLHKHSNEVSERILNSRLDLSSERISFLIPQAYEYIACQWGIWKSGGVAVPLCPQHSLQEMEYMITQSRSSLILCHNQYLPKLQPVGEKLNIQILPISNFSEIISSSFNDSYRVMRKDRPAMIVYTSGTTGKPKGVVHTHESIEAQVQALVTSWEWTSRDHILETLPLHHVHGIVNILCCALYSGAKITMHPKFDAKQVWSEFLKNDDLNVFMAVPTIYSKLLNEWENFDDTAKAQLRNSLKKFRLMVSGSMALTDFVFNQWKNITGHTLLERYGMSETGMILSNPLNGLRRPGWVGKPLPGVEVKTTDGELLVRGPAIFKEYFDNPKATSESFDSEKYFKTGDIVEIDTETQYYKILGRASADIIKSGGFKISALDIERELMEHPNIAEVSIVGVPDEEYGQIIGMIYKSKNNVEFKLEELQKWCRERLAPYKLPRVLIKVNEIPRNQMGKINKKELLHLFKK